MRYPRTQGRTLQEAGAGVPHGTIRQSTAGQIREAGGSVQVAPELTRAKVMNYQHVNVCEGGGACFSEPLPNPAPKGERIQ